MASIHIQQSHYSPPGALAIFSRVSGSLNLAVRFNARDGRSNSAPSRQRRLNYLRRLTRLRGSIVADATGELRVADRALKRTAKINRRAAAGETPQSSCAKIRVMAVAKSSSQLFISQRHHRIYFRRPPRGDQTRQQRHENQQ